MPLNTNGQLQNKILNLFNVFNNILIKNFKSPKMLESSLSALFKYPSNPFLFYFQQLAVLG
jgi:hypothetical protein